MAPSEQECDERTTEYKTMLSPTAYDPRCRPWFQDAVMEDNTGVIFTNPYQDIDTGLRQVTVAAPVRRAEDPTLLLGVVGIDLDFSDIEQSINDLKVVGDEGYAFLLAPGGTGEVVVHKDLTMLEQEAVYITDLESEVDREEFNLILETMSRDCSGSATYSKNDATWILAWNHETASSSGWADGSGACGSGGYVTVVTVSKDALLEVSTPPMSYRNGFHRVRYDISYRTVFIEFDVIYHIARFSSSSM